MEMIYINDITGASRLSAWSLNVGKHEMRGFISVNVNRGIIQTATISEKVAKVSKPPLSPPPPLSAPLSYNEPLLNQ